MSQRFPQRISCRLILVHEVDLLSLSSPVVLTVRCLSSMMHSFDVVAIGIKDVGRVIGRVICWMELRCAFATATSRERVGIECIHGLLTLARKSHMHAARRTLSFLDLVDRKVV